LAVAPNNTFFCNHLGLPAITVAAGVDWRGLPFGVQFVGPRGADGQASTLARHYERAIRSHIAPIHKRSSSAHTLQPGGSLETPRDYRSHLLDPRPACAWAPRSRRPAAARGWTCRAKTGRPRRVRPEEQALPRAGHATGCGSDARST
jgi:hypothetical protein